MQDSLSRLLGQQGQAVGSGITDTALLHIWLSTTDLKCHWAAHSMLHALWLNEVLHGFGQPYVVTQEKIETMPGCKSGSTAIQQQLQADCISTVLPQLLHTGKMRLEESLVLGCSAFLLQDWQDTARRQQCILDLHKAAQHFLLEEAGCTLVVLFQPQSWPAGYTLKQDPVAA